MSARAERLFLASIVALASVAAAGRHAFAEDEPIVTRASPDKVVRGGEVTVSGTHLPGKAEDIHVTLDGTELAAAITSTEPNALRFRVPMSQALGKFTVRVSFQGAKDQPFLAPTSGAQGLLEVVKDHAEAVRLRAPFPKVAYPEGSTKPLQLTLLGENFSGVASDNHLEIDGRLVTDGDLKPITPKVLSSRELAFAVPPDKFSGRVSVAITVGSERSDPVEVVLSDVPRAAPTIVAGVAGLVVLALLLLVAGKAAPSHAVADQKYKFLSLFIEQETDTYSLSRVQVYLWMVAAIFAYVYFVVSRSMVQHDFDWNVPKGLAALVGGSLSTAVLARGASNVRGPKGAGDVQPSFSDLFTSGGVVAPERVQFFAWTLLGFLTYVGLVLARDPGELSDFPTLPEGFLYLMGASSAGYLGGKLVRSAGPVIDSVVGKADANGETLEIRGRNLSARGSIKIGSDEIPYRRSTDEPKPAASDTVLTVLEKEQDSSDATLAAALKLMIPGRTTADVGKDFTLVNSDGQKAVWPIARG